MEWKHPTGKAPKSVVLVCLGPSRSTFEAACMERDTPSWLRECDEVWTVNRGTLNYPVDMSFVMDYLSGESANYPSYAAMLHRKKIPIITSKKTPDWPDNVLEFPFSAVWNWLLSDVKPNHQEWWHNSIPYVVAYAAWQKVSTLMIIGADYHHHATTRHEDGSANLSYWIGRLESTGLKVTVPETTTLLGAHARDWIYGYPPDLDPRPPAVARRQKFQELIGKSSPA